MRPDKTARVPVWRLLRPDLRPTRPTSGPVDRGERLEEDLEGGEDEEAAGQQAEVPAGQGPPVEVGGPPHEHRAKGQPSHTDDVLQVGQRPHVDREEQHVCHETRPKAPAPWRVRVTEAAAAAPRKPAEGPASRTQSEGRAPQVAVIAGGHSSPAVPSNGQHVA